MMVWWVLAAEFTRGVALGSFYTFLMKFNKWTRFVFYALFLVAIIAVVVTPEAAIPSTLVWNEFVVFIVGMFIGNIIGREIVKELREDWIG